MLLNAGPGASGIPFLKLSSLLLSKGITGVRFAEHQRCFIRTQTRSLPTATEAVAEDATLPVRLPLPTPPPPPPSAVAQILALSISSYLPLSKELTGLCDVCETVRKLPTSPQPLCGSHQIVFAVNLAPILIFNHLLQSSIQIACSSMGAQEVLEGEVSH